MPTASTAKFFRGGAKLAAESERLNAFSEAIRNNDIGKVAEFFGADAEQIENALEEQLRAFSQAIHDGRVKGAQALVDKNRALITKKLGERAYDWFSKAIDKARDNQCRRLANAIIHGDEAVIGGILANGIEVTQPLRASTIEGKKEDTYLPLELAIICKQPNAVKTLMEKGADVNANGRSRRGQPVSLLMLAMDSLTGRLDKDKKVTAIVEILLKTRIDFANKAKAPYGSGAINSTVFYQSVHSRRFDWLELLVKKLKAQLKGLGYTEEEISAEVAKAVSAENIVGYTPLGLAIEKASKDKGLKAEYAGIIKLLVAEGATELRHDDWLEVAQEICPDAFVSSAPVPGGPG